MKKPILLDLFCGAGGAAVGYHHAGFDVIGIDIVPQPHYPFPFIQDDAFCLSSWPYFDVVHASPPCQAHTTLNSRTGYVDDLSIQNVREVLRQYPYVIENVPGAPLFNAVQVCGTSFNLGVIRHRLFESNLRIVGSECNHIGTVSDGTYITCTGNGSNFSLFTGSRAMKIEHYMSKHELAQAIPPAYTEYIGKQILAQL